MEDNEGKIFVSFSKKTNILNYSVKKTTMAVHHYIMQLVKVYLRFIQFECI